MVHEIVGIRPPVTKKWRGSDSEDPMDQICMMAAGTEQKVNVASLMQTQRDSVAPSRVATISVAGCKARALPRLSDLGAPPSW
jgi:hypothetical protein